MRLLLLTLYALILTPCIHAYSQETQTPLTAKFIIEGGIEYGGDEILKVFFTNGSEQTMRAGQGGYLAIGGQFEFPKAKFLLLRTTIGIKYNTTAADNADIRLTRVPINIMPYWKINNDFRLGVGITIHQNIKLKSDGFVADVDFKSNIGPRIEFGYKWFAASYTAIKYTAFGEDISANSFGLSVSLTLPKDK